MAAVEHEWTPLAVAMLSRGEKYATVQRELHGLGHTVTRNALYKLRDRAGLDRVNTDASEFFPAEWDADPKHTNDHYAQMLRILAQHLQRKQLTPLAQSQLQAFMRALYPEDGPDMVVHYNGPKGFHLVQRRFWFPMLGRREAIDTFIRDPSRLDDGTRLVNWSDSGKNA